VADLDEDEQVDHLVVTGLPRHVKRDRIEPHLGAAADDPRAESDGPRAQHI
jgi:hypothetical protein